MVSVPKWKWQYQCIVWFGSTYSDCDNCRQCFDTVGLASERASSLSKLSDEVLVWLSVWSEVLIDCIWSNCIPKPPSSLTSFKSRLVLPSGTSLCMQVVLEKRLLNGCSSVLIVTDDGRMLWWACLCFCVSVRKHISRTVYSIFTNFFARYILPCLIPPLVALWYVVYYQFYGWHPIFT